MMLVKITENNVASRKIIDTAGMSEEERLSQLVDLGIDLFVCGAVEEEFIKKAGSYGIRVIHDVAAEAEDILPALMDGSLKDGHGLANQPDDGASPVQEIPREIADAGAGTEPVKELAIDCIDCVDRLCLKGKSCTSEIENLFPVEEYAEFQHSMEVTMDISAETERKLCRVAEFIYYCIGMEYKHVGVAFCVEMFQEVEILTRLLRRFFKVSPVCCKIGGRTQHDMITAAEGVLCNPIGQARVLNELKTDINVTVGLCVGCDWIYARHSDAPTSTLFVKDKSLANNPVSALYSKYYIDDILKEV
jgi:uncharacterized metal-binding protein